MLAPSWVRTNTQPAALDDVIQYLTMALKTEFKGSTTIDIGGERLTFLDMLKKAAEFYSLKRFIIPLPFFSPKISSYWLILLTPVPFRLASALVAGLKVESVVTNQNAGKYFPEIKPLSYIESLKRAASEEEAAIISHWSDGSSAWFNSGKKTDESVNATHTAYYKKDITGLSLMKVWESIISIGGNRGWLSMNYLWKIRGLIDKVSGGPGINRGRRNTDELRIGDSIDFWTVIDLIYEKRLLLAAQMKLPGQAWLEFVLNESDLIITAHFIPKGVYGRFYWYILFPFHVVIFKGMLRRIINDSLKTEE
jgi:hypothetical protein